MARKVAGSVAVLAVSLGLVIGFLLFLQARDESTLDAPAERSGAPAGLPGRATAADAPAARVPVTRDRRELSTDQLRTALQDGNVVFVYGAPDDEGALRALQTDLTGPFDADLARAGQAVVLARRPGADGITALALRRELRTSSADDPRLRAFAEALVGRAAAK